MIIKTIKPATTDEMHTEALTRMKLLGLSKEVISDFDSEFPSLHISTQNIVSDAPSFFDVPVITANGISFKGKIWARYDTTCSLDEFEDLMQLASRKNVRFYHCNKAGSFLSALFVSARKDEWKHDRECIERGFVKVYCKSDFTDGKYEVGDIFYTTIDGLLFRKE
jgi:hypothetical protein